VAYVVLFCYLVNSRIGVVKGKVNIWLALITAYYNRAICSITHGNR